MHLCGVNINLGHAVDCARAEVLDRGFSAVAVQRTIVTVTQITKPTQRHAFMGLHRIRGKPVSLYLTQVIYTYTWTGGIVDEL